MSLLPSEDVCVCEKNQNISDIDRLECLSQALLSFYKSRRQQNRFPKDIFNNVRRVSLIKFAALLNGIDNPAAHAAESVILLRFFYGYATTHPRFALYVSRVFQTYGRTV